MTATENSRTRSRSRFAVVAATVLAALLLWTVLAPLAGVDLAARQGDSITKIGAVSVAVASAVAALAAWGLLVLLERQQGGQAKRIWTLVALIGGLVSLSGPMVNGVGTDGKLGLAAFHLVVAAVLIPGLRRTASPS